MATEVHRKTFRCVHEDEEESFCHNHLKILMYKDTENGNLYVDKRDLILKIGKSAVEEFLKSLIREITPGDKMNTAARKSTRCVALKKHVSLPEGLKLEGEHVKIEQENKNNTQMQADFSIMFLYFVNFNIYIF